jgi:hypothetical protein
MANKGKYIMATLAEIRAKLQAQETKTTTSNSQSDNAIFAHWNIPEDSSTTVRFLPDADESNTFFWKERQMMKMTFPGIKGQDESKPVTIQVPCVEMWGDSCPVHAEIRPWFKDTSMEEIARRYWKKRSYVFQGFVTQTDLQEENKPENPIRRFVISPQIYKIISSALMDPDFSNIPTDYESGTDFKITKGKKGQYADYGTSNWARRERSLDQAERDAIATHGLFNLNDFLPKKPDAEALNAIFEMFEASVDGQLYDPERFSSYYRPYGMDAPAAGASSASAAVAPRPAVGATGAGQAPRPVAPPVAQDEDDDIPFQSNAQVAAAKAAPAAGGAAPSASDILAMIRSRKEA